MSARPTPDVTATGQGDHVVLKCTGSDCGMRYPSPINHPRMASCALCESPTDQVGSFASPPPAIPPPNSDTARQDSSVLVGVLDNIRSAQNVGTMLRSADGVALDHVYLGGLTAAADHPKVAKTALGAQTIVPSTSYLDLMPCIESLQSDGYEIWAVDFTERSEPLQMLPHRPARLAFVVGNELAGVDPAILARADRHIHLDMYGQKTTVNVAVAFGTIAYWLRALQSV